MQSARFNGYPQPPPSVNQGDLSLDDTLLRLQSFSLSEILALRRSLLRHKENEIEWKFFKHRDRLRSSTSTCPPGSHLSYQSVSTPSLYTDANSIASSRDSRLSFAPTATNFSRLYLRTLDSSSVITPLMDDSYGQFGSDSALNQIPSAVDPALITYSPVSDLTSFHASTDALAVSALRKETGATTLFHNQMGPPMTKDVAKPFPCPEPHCSCAYSESRTLLEHVTSQHDQDVEFICTHPNCNYKSYSDKKANRHHTASHNRCSRKGVDCGQKSILRTKKYWGCGICLQPPFLSGRKWAEHYCQHFLKESEALTDGAMGLPKDRVNITLRILCLLKQQATNALWIERDQKLLRTPGDFWRHAWDDSDSAVDEILHALQYGLFRHETIEKEEVARQLVDKIFELSSITYYPVEGGYENISKRRASMSPGTLRFLYDLETPSSHGHVAEDQVQGTGQTPADILDNFTTFSGYLNRE